MKRYGPLIAVPGALAVGDPGRHHLRLMPEALVIRDGVTSQDIVSWDGITAITLDVPTTRFRLPGLVGTVLLGAATAVLLADLEAGPDDGSVTIVIDGDAGTLPLSRHHVGGYWGPTVDGAQLLLAHLIAHPQQRALLKHPEQLIDIAARLARKSG